MSVGVNSPLEHLKNAYSVFNPRKYCKFRKVDSYGESMHKHVSGQVSPFSAGPYNLLAANSCSDRILRPLGLARELITLRAILSASLTSSKA